MSFVEIKDLSLEELIKMCSSLLHLIEDISDDIDKCNERIEDHNEQIDKLNAHKSKQLTVRNAKQSFYDECFELLKKRMTELKTD